MQITLDIDETRDYTDEELSTLARSGLIREQVKADIRAERQQAAQEQAEQESEIEKRIKRWKA